MGNNCGNKFNIFTSHLQRKLLLELKISKKVFIVPHTRMDYDAIASAVALYHLCNYLNIESYIVTNDEEKNMNSSLRNIVNNCKKKYKFITTEEFEKLKCDDDLIILTDVNSTALIPINNINEHKRVFVIDHHKPDQNLIKTNKIFINATMSSASEITYYLLKNLNIRVTPSLAQLLLTGIYLDTNGLNFVKNHNTYSTISRLIDDGANFDETQNLFAISDLDEDTKNNLLSDISLYTEVSKFSIAICMNKKVPDTIYTHEQLAEAVDNLIRRNLDAAFVIGFVDRASLGEGHTDEIAIKARSRIADVDEIDVGNIMQCINGGGDKNRAASVQYTSDIFKVKRLVKSITLPGASMGNGNDFRR